MTAEDKTWEAPTDGGIEERIGRLERMAEGLRELQQEDGRLTAGVERLGDNTAALTKVLTAVDEQAKSIARVDRKAEAVAFTAEERAATAAIERRLFLRRAYLAAAATAALTLGAVLGGAWLTDRHLQTCVLNGPTTADEREFCNLTFPGHDHPEEITLKALLRRGAENQRKQALAARACCERQMTRARAQIDRELRLAAADIPATRPIHRENAIALQQTIIDCNKAYPLPSPPPVPR